MSEIINIIRRKLERYNIKLINNIFEFLLLKNFEKYVVEIEKGTKERLRI